MTNTYRIRPIPLCHMTMDKGFYTYWKHYGEKVEVPAYAWLIEGGDEPILVDTGCSATEFRKYALMATDIRDIIPIEEALEGLGVAASGIQTIIMTHLDTDHILNARKFPNARLIVQEAELQFARNPHPCYAKKYHQHLYEGLNFATVRGDADIAPGVAVMATPGHTFGTQSVVVTTRQGKAVITGFCTIDDNFSDQGDIIPGSLVDPLRAYDSLVRVRRIADIIIPNHSQSLLTTKSIP
ncbi:MAG: N-acyl homoserine lactonase family protein [Chloroflexi bacterium]|nr:N-acyl homoserine lactonase family protein [Chloroflexota bacterium]